MKSTLSRARARRAAGAVGAVLGALLVLVPAGPAGAANANIAISGPSAGAVVGSSSVAITGDANIDPGLLGRNAISDLQVAVSFGGSVIDSCDSASCAAGIGRASTTFGYTSHALVRNGPYIVSATVTANEYLIGGPVGPATRTGTATTSFSVGAPPAAPRNVRAQVNGDGSVTLAWDPNAEPDLIGYQIKRRDPGSSGTKVVNPFLRQTSWTDQSTAQTGGGFGYTVTAFRPGADGTATATTVMQASSAAAVANVPVPTTTAPPAGVTQSPTTTVAPAPSAGSDLSTFLAQAAKAGAIPPAPPKATLHASPLPRVLLPSATALGPPDTYAPTLPYSADSGRLGAVPAPELSNGRLGRPAPGRDGGQGGGQVALTGRPPGSAQHRSMLFSVAGGMLLCVLGFVVRAANRRPDLAPLETVAPGGGDGDGDGAPAPVAGRAAGPVAGRAVGPADGPAVASMPAGTADEVEVLVPAG